MASDTHSLKVIGCGFGRTGTMTLKHTLEELGLGPCYHGTEIASKTFYLDEWINIANNTDESIIDWNKTVFAHPKLHKIYNSSVDWPVAHYYKSLYAFYPDAKFILTVRDPQQWYESMINTIVPVPLRLNKHLAWALFLRFAIIANPAAAKFNFVNGKIYGHQFGGMWNFYDKRSLCIMRFVQHIEEVKKTIDKKRLFIIDWDRKDQQVMYKELCDFLDVEYNGKTFVRLNDTHSMRKLMTIMIIRTLFQNTYLFHITISLVVLVFTLYFMC